MVDDKPHLTLVGSSTFSQAYEDEFLPLPYYPWDERPGTLPIEAEEAATALYLAHGDTDRAAALLKVHQVRLARLLRHSPRLQRVREETLGSAVARAESVPIQTLFDAGADARRLEWASTKLLQSRAGASSLLAPAPPANVSSSVTLDQPKRTITFRWRRDSDDVINTSDAEKTSDDAG